MPDHPSTRALMAWYLDAGVDETIGEQPVNRYLALDPAPAASPPVTPVSAASAATAGAADRPQAPLADGPSPASRKAGQADDAEMVRVPRSSFQPALFAGSPGNGASGAGSSGNGDAAVQSAYALADAAQNVAELRAALESFDGCALRKTATNLVFTDGRPDGRVVFVGEAPGAEEDRQGLPFVGPSGKLMDQMLLSIGLDREQVLITNTVFWRPPGNRSPTTQEIAICLPFLERLIELVDPDVLVAVGGPAATALLAQPQGITKLRGKWFSYESSRMVRPIPATAIFHPAYLLRSPAQKREVWRDLRAIRRKLDEI